MLRTKNGDHNSYKSSDEVNNINWDALTADSDAWQMVHYYAELISVRKNNPFIKEADQSFKLLDGNAIECTWSVTAADGGPTTLLGILILNPADEEMEYTLPEGPFILVLSSDPALQSGAALDGTVTIPAKGAVFFVPGK